MSNSKWLTFLILGLSIIFLALFLVNRECFFQEFGEDIYKITYQFILLTVFGGIISLVFREYSREQEERTKEINRKRDEAQNKNLKWMTLHNELVKIYNDTKKIRRLTRARVRRKSENSQHIKIDLEEYDNLLQVLIDNQLSFEFFVRQFKNEAKFSKLAMQLREKLQYMEKYLNDIIREYENSYETLASNKKEERIKKFPIFAEFIGELEHHEEVSFEQEFKIPFLEALEIIENEIIPITN